MDSDRRRIVKFNTLLTYLKMMLKYVQSAGAVEYTNCISAQE